jgi:hypothetical protein
LIRPVATVALICHACSNRSIFNSPKLVVLWTNNSQDPGEAKRSSDCRSLSQSCLASTSRSRAMCFSVSAPQFDLDLHIFPRFSFDLPQSFPVRSSLSLSIPALSVSHKLLDQDPWRVRRFHNLNARGSCSLHPVPTFSEPLQRLHLSTWAMV